MTVPPSPRAEGFSAQVVRGEGWAHLAVGGEADSSTSCMLAGIGISALVGPSVHEVIIDLGHVTFFDASAVAALVTIQHGANDRHTALWLANVPDRVSRLLALTGVLPFFNVENEGSRQEPPQPSSDLDDVSRRHRWTYPRHQPSLTHRTPGRR